MNHLFTTQEVTDALFKAEENYPDLEKVPTNAIMEILRLLPDRAPAQSHLGVGQIAKAWNASISNDDPYMDWSNLAYKFQNMLIKFASQIQNQESASMTEDQGATDFDPVQKAAHYNQHPSGVECIDIIRWHNFNIGNAMKYLWRSGLKEEQGVGQLTKAIQDLEKAAYYLNDEINRLKGDQSE